MNIGLDLWCCTEVGGGIGRYADELTHALVALASRQGEEHLFRLFPGFEEPKWMQDLVQASGGRVLRGSGPWRGLRRGIPARQWRAALLLAPRIRELGLEVYHSPDILDVPLVRTGQSRLVATIHDISPVVYPETFRWRHSWIWNRISPTVLRRVDRLIAVSNSAASELREWCPDVGGKITVIYEGVSTRFRPAKPEVIAEVRIKHRLPKQYVLCLGTVQPRKNLGRLLEAYSLLAQSDAGTPPLVIAGRLGWLYQPILQRVSELGLQKLVCFVGFVPDADLPALLSGASVFVYPSFYEGFGLPVLEAMACGTPVVTGDRSSLPEVAGDAAMLVDPFDVEAIANGLSIVLRNSQMATSLARRGLVRAARFTWEEAARRTLQVYLETEGDRFR